MLLRHNTAVISVRLSSVFSFLCTVVTKMFRDMIDILLDNIDKVFEYVFGGGLIALISGIVGAKQERKRHELENESSAITNFSKMADEYQEYIEQLKTDRENAIKERNDALRERDEYKKQMDDMWKEINELKSKTSKIELRLAKATLLLYKNGITLEDDADDETINE